MKLFRRDRREGRVRAGATGIALFAAFLATGCAGGGVVVSNQITDSIAPPKIGEARAPEEAFGKYLAGRHAQNIRDRGPAADFLAEALAKAPDNLPLLNRTFLAFLSDGRIGQAVPLAKRLVAAEADRSGFAQMLLTVDAIRAEDFPEALRQAEKLSDTGFNRLFKPLLKGWAAAGAGKYDQAIATVIGMGKTDGIAIFQHYHSALIHTLSGKLAQAESSYGEAMQGGGDKAARIVLGYGELLARQGKGAEAEELFRRYLKEIPENPLVKAALRDFEAGRPFRPAVSSMVEGAAEVLYGGGALILREGATDAAGIYLRLALYLRPNFPVVQTLLADISEAGRAWEEAIEIYKGIDPKSPYGYSAKSRTAWALQQLDRTEEAIKLLREAATQWLEETEALVTLGDILRAEARFDEAAIEYGRAIDRTAKAARDGEPAFEERHWTLFYARGIAYERSKQWPAAEADFLQALELRPDQPLVLNYLGYSWVEQGVNFDRARKMIERAVELRPNDGYITDSLGWVLYRLGKYVEAVPHLERAVQLRPEDPVINDHLGDAYWRVGRRNEAKFQWQRSLWLGPAEEHIPQLEEKLRQGLSPGEG